MKKCIRGQRGSITIEAVISLPIFICFFALLMFSTKTTCINMYLNHTVNETAKQLAASAYPIALLNQLEDEFFSEGIEGGIPSFTEEKEKIKDYLSSSSSDIFQKLLTGDLDKDDLIEAFTGIKENVVSDYTSGAARYLANSMGDNYYEIKAKAKYKAADMLLESYLKNNWIDRKNISIVFIELPQSDIEYQLRVEDEGDSGYSQICNEISFTPEKDDVVVSIQYRTIVPIPFLRDKEIVYRFTATEKAWIYGSNGVYTVDGEYETQNEEGKSQISNKEVPVEESYKNLQIETVFVTKVGKRYHKNGCRYLAKSKIPIKIDDASKKGYTPCKKCYGK